MRPTKNCDDQTNATLISMWKELKYNVVLSTRGLNASTRPVNHQPHRIHHHHHGHQHHHHHHNHLPHTHHYNHQHHHRRRLQHFISTYLYLA